jgi:drug/metabolite transporter (DMT)-like permease
MRTRSTPLLWLPLAGASLVVLIWAGNTIVGKVMMREASPLLISLVRFSLMGLLFYLPAFLLLHRGAQRFTREEWVRVIVMGLVGTTGSQVLYMFGLRLTQATDAGIYQIVTPIFVVLIAWVWLGERLSRMRVAGIFLAAFGSLLLATGGGIVSVAGSEPLGAALIILSNLCWSFYTVLSKKVLARRSPLLVLAAANLVAGVAIWPISIAAGVLPELPGVLHWSPTAWLMLGYLTLLTGSSSQWLYFWSIREIGPSRVAAMLYLKPVFNGLLAAVFLAEAPTWLTFLCGGIILLGVWLVNRPQRAQVRQPAERPARALGAASS